MDQDRETVRLKSGRTVWRDPLADTWGTFVAEDLGPWHLFGGLTFDQERFARYQVRVGKSTRTYVRPPGWRLPRDLAERLFHRWESDVRALVGPVEYVVALEYHRNGWPHLHPLLRLDRGLQQGDIAALGTLWRERCGLEALEVPRDRLAVCAYAAKYLSKDLARGDVILSPGLTAR